MWFVGFEKVSGALDSGQEPGVGLETIPTVTGAAGLYFAS